MPHANTVPAPTKNGANGKPSRHRKRSRTADGDDDRGPKSADLLVGLADGAELFHDSGGNAHATVSIGDHRETWPIKSSGFKRWLQRQYWERHESAPSTQAMTDALGVIEGKAVFEGREHDVYIRVAGDIDRSVIDLGTPDWSVAVVTSDGWRIDTNSPVKFRRARGMRPLAIPQRGGDISELRRYLNVRAEDWPLAASWLLMAFNSAGPYPVINLTGEAGSGKSTASRVLRRLIDPNEAPLRREPRDERDLVIAANNSWVVAFDNLSRLPVWLSDGLCRLATGGGFATRQLYSDSEEAIFNSMRPAILNGIEDVAIRGDLMDRCLNINLERIPENQRRTEGEFWIEFDAAVPRILGALLDALAVAMRRFSGVRLDRLPRMADFARWSVAGEPGLGLSEGEFLRSYESARASANEMVVESSLIGRGVLLLLDKQGGQWEGTASKLLDELENLIPESDRKRNRDWPSDSSGMGNRMKRLAPNLRDAGVGVLFGRNGKRRTINLEKAGKSVSLPSPPSPPRKKQGGTGDGPGGNAVTVPSPPKGQKPRENATGDSDDGYDGKIPVHSTNGRMEF